MDHADVIRGHAGTIPDHELEVLHLANDAGEHVEKIAERAGVVAALERTVMDRPDMVAERAHMWAAAVHRLAGLPCVIAAFARVVAAFARVVAQLAHLVAPLAHPVAGLAQAEATRTGDMPEAAFEVAELSMNAGDSADEVAEPVLKVTEPAGPARYHTGEIGTDVLDIRRRAGAILAGSRTIAEGQGGGRMPLLASRRGGQGYETYDKASECSSREYLRDRPEPV